MIRTTLDKAHIKRTIRPLYGWTQSTPKDAKLDPAWDRSVKIFPGMVAARTEGDNVTLIGQYDASGTPTPMQPAGLFGLYIGGDDIDEVLEQGVNSVAVWVLGPDAEFEVLAPAFDDSLTWTDPADGRADVLVHAWVSGAGRGKLAPAGSSKASHVLSTAPVARLVKVNSDTKITIAGLRGTV